MEKLTAGALYEKTWHDELSGQLSVGGGMMVFAFNAKGVVGQWVTGKAPLPCPPSA